MNNLFLALGLIVIGTLCAALGQIFLKIASPRMSISLRGIFHLPFVAGMLFYGLSMILTIVALKWADLTLIAPMAALNYVWAAFLSVKILKEKMNKWKWLGIVIIIIGVIIIVR